MTHLSGEQMLSLYYGERNENSKRHLEECSACRLEFEKLRLVLAEADRFAIPERDGQYGGDVWRRIQPCLPPRPRKASRWFWMWLGPAFAAVALAAFLAGVFTQRHAADHAFSEQARSRVLVMAMSDHLERSQMVLAELVNANPEAGLFAEERANARDLLAENRLLREMAGRTANPLQASVLDQLERVLMDVANGPVHPSERQVADVQQRIKTEGLLLRVRMLDANARRKEQKL